MRNTTGHCRRPSRMDFRGIRWPGFTLLILALLLQFGSLAQGSEVVGWGVVKLPGGSLTNLTGIAAGSFHSLALKADGSIVGWGLDNYGQATSPAGTDFVAISAGTYHSLALKADGSIVGWGRDEYGQATPPADPNFVAIAAGGSHSLALKGNGSIIGWGLNDDGQATPPADPNFVAIAAGQYHSLALKADGSIVGWGSNYDWDGIWVGQATPPAGTYFVAISAGAYHSLALKADGSIVGWGMDNYGQATPPAGTDFVALAAGRYHSLALKTDGSIVGWGHDAYSQATPPAGTDFIAIAAGYLHSLALKADGSIIGWGYDSFGQATSLTGTDFVAITSGGRHSLTLKADGSIVGSGRDNYGQVTPPAGTDFVAIAAGQFHSLTLKADGSIVGWGSDDAGQATPPSGTDFVAIAAVWYRSLALRGGELTNAFKIKFLSPNHTGNLGPVRIDIFGSGFKPGASVKLLKDETELDPNEIIFINSWELKTRFDLTDTPVGKYDVVVSNPGGSAVSLPEAFEIVEGGEPKPWAKLTVPPEVRPERNYTAYVDYGNEGNAAMSARLYSISSPSGAPLRLDQSKPYTTSPVWVLGIGSYNPVGTLLPGESRRVPVYFRSIDVDIIQFNLDEVIDYDSMIDWNLVEQQIRPEGVDPNTWDPMFARLQSQIGSTWGDYIAALNNNATRRAKYGFGTNVVNTLFSDEIEKAYEDADGVIGGRVHLSDTGENLTGVQVSVSQIDGPGFAAAITNDNGQFMVQFVPPGTYKVQVDGYVLDASVEVEVAEDQDPDPVELAVQLSGIITGTVTAQGGASLEGAFVTAIIDPNGIQVYTANTDENGNYEIPELPTGTYRLSCGLQNYVAEERIGVSVAQGATTEGIDFDLVFGGSITGIVMESDTGDFIEGAQVLAISITDCNSVHLDISDENGEYTVTGLASGSWKVYATASGRIESEPNILKVTSPESITHNFALTPAASIEGTVQNAVGQPIEAATIIAVGDTGFGIAISNVEGNYLIETLQAGIYSVEVKAAGYVSQEVSSLEVTEGEIITGIDFHLASQASISRIANQDIDITRLSQTTNLVDSENNSSRELLLETLPVFVPYMKSLENGMADCQTILSARNQAAEDLAMAQQLLWDQFLVSQDLAWKFDKAAAKSLAATWAAYEATNFLKAYLVQAGFSKWVSDLLGSFLMWEAQLIIDSRNPQADLLSQEKIISLLVSFNVANVKEILRLLDAPQSVIDKIGPFVSILKGLCSLYRDTVGLCKQLMASVALEWDYAEQVRKAKWLWWRLHLDYLKCLFCENFGCGKPPNPPTDPEDEETSDVLRAIDPNIKKGRKGYDPNDVVPGQENRYVDPNQPLDYVVYFENLPAATAPAQEVCILDILSPILDWSTIELGEIVFGDQVVASLAGRVDGTDSVDLVDSDYRVDIEADFDPYTGRLTWRLRTIDPNTDDLPTDPHAGFLPPNDPNTGCGEGHVSFRIYPQPGFESARITNKAIITFDTEAPVQTNVWLNTVDGKAPESSVLSLPERTVYPNFDLTWQGDDADGCGIAGYDVYLSTDDGPYMPLMENTMDTSTAFIGQFSSTYKFYSIAHDYVGNVEEIPAQPDAVTTIVGPDLFADGIIDSKDLELFLAQWLRSDCEEIANDWCLGADFNHSGQVDLTDYLFLTSFWMNQ